VKDATSLPARPARWFIDRTFSAGEFAGEAHRVLVRIVDGDE
jgi:hypothetical protein